MKAPLTVAAICALLVGCGGNYTSIFRSVDGNMLVDAKQRAIIKNEEDKRGDVNARVCAEPSPDVYSVLAESLATSSVFETQSQQNIKAQLAGSIAESGADIGLRTQTIQVLRDMMYRLCERYLSGAITELEFEQQASRDQRLIVAVLSIEQLTGAVRPPRTILTSKATVDLGRDVVEIEKLLVEAREDRAKQVTVVAEKQAAFDPLNTTAQEAKAEHEAAVENQKKLEGQKQEADQKVQKAESMVATEEADLAKAKEDLRLAQEKAAPAAPAPAEPASEEGAAADNEQPVNPPSDEAAGLEEPTIEQLEARVQLLATALEATKSKLELEEKNRTDIGNQLVEADEQVEERSNELKTAEENVKNPKTALDDANETLANIDERIESLNEALDRAQNSVATLASGSGEIEQLSGSASNIDKDTAEVLSKAVVRIVEQTFDDDETERSCVSIINGVARRAGEKIKFDEDEITTFERAAKISELSKSANNENFNDPNAYLDIVGLFRDRRFENSENLRFLIDNCARILNNKFQLAARSAEKRRAIAELGRIDADILGKISNVDLVQLLNSIQEDIKKGEVQIEGFQESFPTLRGLR